MEKKNSTQMRNLTILIKAFFNRKLTKMTSEIIYLCSYMDRIYIYRMDNIETSGHRFILKYQGHFQSIFIPLTSHFNLFLFI